MPCAELNVLNLLMRGRVSLRNDMHPHEFQRFPVATLAGTIRHIQLERIWRHK